MRYPGGPPVKDTDPGAQQYTVEGAGFAGIVNASPVSAVNVFVKPKDVVSGLKVGQFFRIVKINIQMVPFDVPAQNPFCGVYRNSFVGTNLLHGTTDARLNGSPFVDVVLNVNDRMLFRFENVNTGGPQYTCSGQLLFYLI